MESTNQEDTPRNRGLPSDNQPDKPSDKQEPREPDYNAPGKPAKLPDPSGKFQVPGL